MQKERMHTEACREECFHIADEDVESGARRDGARLDLFLRVCDLGWDLKEQIISMKCCMRECMRSYPGDLLELLEGFSEPDQVESLQTSHGEYMRSHPNEMGICAYPVIIQKLKTTIACSYSANSNHNRMLTHR